MYRDFFSLHFWLLWVIITIDSGSISCIMSESSETFGRSYLGTGALESAANCQDKSFELLGLILETGRNLNELTTPVGGTLFYKAWADAIEDHRRDDCVLLMTLLFSQEQY